MRRRDMRSSHWIAGGQWRLTHEGYRVTAVLVDGDNRGMWRIALVLLLLAGCGVGTCNPSFEPLAVEQSGVMINLPADADLPDGMPVECRGLEVERCRRGAANLPEVRDIEGVERIVVSCVGRCTLQGGELRMVVVVGEETQLLGNGGYGEFEQSCS